MLFNITTNFIAGSIFNGTFTITICLLIVNLFKIKLTKIDKPTLIKAINTVLLLGALIYTTMWIIELFMAYYSGAEYEQYRFTNRLFGSYWWAALTLLIRSILLPQILWIGKLRRSFICTIIVISVWGIVNIPMMLIDIRVAGFNLWSNFYWWLINLGQLIFYGLILTGVYFMLKRKVV